MNFNEQLAQAYGVVAQPVSEAFTLEDIQSVCNTATAVRRDCGNAYVIVEWCFSHKAYRIYVYPSDTFPYAVEWSSPTNALDAANNELHRVA